MADQFSTAAGGSNSAVADENKRGRNLAPMEMERPRSGEEATSTLGEEAVYRIGEEMLHDLISARVNFPGLALLVLAPQVTVLEAPNNNPNMPEGHDEDGHEVAITIDQPVEPAKMHSTMSPTLLPRVLLTLAILTLIMDIGTMLYKPAKGVVFGHHRLLYYLTLAGICVVGVGEAWTAIWISRSLDAYRRHSSFGRVVLCIGVATFVIIASIGGFTFTSG